MLEQEFTPQPAKERRQLAVLAVGLGLIGGVLWWLKGGGLFPGLLLTAALGAAAGAVAHAAIGRDVYLVFAVVGLLTGRVVSWLMLRAMYGLAILGLGSLFRLFGMDRLHKRFEVCKARDTMFEEAPGSDRESFGRQS
jgi:hypothetical protein